MLEWRALRVLLHQPSQMLQRGRHQQRLPLALRYAATPGLPGQRHRHCCLHQTCPPDQSARLLPLAQQLQVQVLLCWLLRWAQQVQPQDLGGPQSRATSTRHTGTPAVRRSLGYHNSAMHAHAARLCSSHPHAGTHCCCLVAAAVPLPPSAVVVWGTAQGPCGNMHAHRGTTARLRGADSLHASSPRRCHG